MIHAGYWTTLAASDHRGNLLLVGSGAAARRRTSERIAARGYAVDAVGMAEALWCWPIDGYDLVLIDATKAAIDALELCEYIKQSRPAQRVAMLVGNRSAQMPFRSLADAVFSGEPDGPEMVRALDFMLGEHLSPVRI